MVYLVILSLVSHSLFVSFSRFILGSILLPLSLSLNTSLALRIKSTNPGKWYTMMKRFGGLDQMSRGKLEISSLERLSDKECAEAVAQSFASVSQEYSPLNRSELPSFLPAGRPEEVNVFQVISSIKKLGKIYHT